MAGLIAGTVLFLSVCSPANAATECFFENSKSVDVNLGNLAFKNVVAPASGFRPMQSDEVAIMPPTDSGVTSNCNVGPDGQTLRAKSDRPVQANDQYVNFQDHHNQPHKSLLYHTTVPGIYYTVGIIDYACPDNMGNIPPDNSYENLYDVGDDNEKTCMNGSQKFVFSVNFWVGSDYLGGKDTFQSSEPAHGSFNISGDSASISVKAVNFTATVK